MTLGQLAPLLLILCASVAALAWLWALLTLRGSTLTGSGLWWLVSLVAITACTSLMLAASEAEGSFEPQDPLPFLAAVSIFCPTMSLLGAKRPQHQAWHFVVATLWCVLALPAMEAAIMRPGESIGLQGLRGWFLWAFIAAEVLNRIGTRLAIVGVLRATAAVLLLAPHLPWLTAWPASERFWVIAVLLECAALMITARRLTRQPRRRSWTQVWLDFRDGWGVLWSLRVMERVNAAAEQYQWPLRLEWSGLRSTLAPAPDDLFSDAAQRQAFEQLMENLLRRFVSDSFVDARRPPIDPSKVST